MSIGKSKIASLLERYLIAERDDEVLASGHRTLQHKGSSTEISIPKDALDEFGLLDEDGDLGQDRQIHITVFASGVAIVDLQTNDRSTEVTREVAQS